ncbi:hypothetical protein BASA81_000067 [Batrachochytrium salamandrivorans]|nr:hypothetical protein BASA81_000067 [Batrachochytrium salamandrivorans]
MVMLVLQMGERDEVGRAFANRVEEEAEICCPKRGERPKRPLAEYAGIVVSGSSSMVTDRLSWSLDTAQMLLPVVGQVPILAVCYGHQMLSDSLGGEVDYLPIWQVGQTYMELTEDAREDELFSVFAQASQVPVHLLHGQGVVRLAQNSVVLGKTLADAHHALRLAKQCWTVQFHPEMTLADMQAPTQRHESLNRPVQALGDVGASADSPGRLLLRRFVEICKRQQVSKL